MKEPAKGSGSDAEPAEGEETDKERVDRNLLELLNELRVALPGVQVLFAFLLVLPFNQGFTTVTSFQRTIYLVTLLATALSAVTLIAPRCTIAFSSTRATRPRSCATPTG